MRQGLKNRVQFNPSDPPRMSVFKTDYLTRQSFNQRVGNANCAPNGECSNFRDASGVYVGPNQQSQQKQTQYYGILKKNFGTKYINKFYKVIFNLKIKIV